MDLILSLTIFICNMITVLICRYAYPVNKEYKNGMILWTHVPAWAIQKKEVQDLVERSQKQWEWYHRIGMIFGLGIGLLSIISQEFSIVVWLFWIMIYVVGCYILLVKIYRKMLCLKQKNYWYDERTKKIRIEKDSGTNTFVSTYIDDDIYWKNGWYSNPNDKRFLVNDKFCNTNMSFNMARPGARILVGSLLIVVLAVIIWCIYLFIPLMHIEFSFTKTGMINV